MHDTGRIGALGAYTDCLWWRTRPAGAGAVTGCSGRTEKPSFVLTFLQVGGSVVRSSRWGRRRMARVLQVSCAVAKTEGTPIRSSLAHSERHTQHPHLQYYTDNLANAHSQT